MTPDQALARLKNKGRDLTRKERDALRTIANMTPEYILQGRYDHDTEWVNISEWSDETPPDDIEVNLIDEDGEEQKLHTRIRTRYVTKPQPLGDQQ